MDLWKTSVIKGILQKEGLWAKKKFGQNFLINKGILDSIVETAEILETDYILEVGPGLGVLTQELCKRAEKVTAIDIDSNMIEILRENFTNFSNLKILNQNVLDYLPLKNKYKIVANIPYNISSPFLNHFLQAENQPTSMTILIQREVAEKICDKVINSILNLQVRLFASSKIIKIVKPGSFFPAPKVDSAIIQIIPHQKDAPNYIPKSTALEILKIAKFAYSQKRKTLQNSLKNYLETISQESLNQLKQKVDLQKRPHQLSMEEWKALSST